MLNKLIKYTFFIVLGILLFWVFDSGMKKQHEIDCQHGRFCQDA